MVMQKAGKFLLIFDDGWFRVGTAFGRSVAICLSPTMK